MAFSIPINRLQAADEVDLYNEIVFLRGLELGAGGRALALGGAYRAISDDLSALYWNPAGLASIRRVELALGLSQALTTDDIQNNNESLSNELSRTRLDELGMVFPVPTYRGSLVFALGYHRVHSFETFGTAGITAPDASLQWEELEEGRLGTWSLGMGLDISPSVSVGLSLNLWTGYDYYSYHDFTFQDSSNWERFDQSLDWDLIGFNAVTGIMLRPSHWLRIGATLESPLKLTINENYAEIGDSTVAGVYYPNTVPPSSYEFKVTRPFRGGLGAAVVIGAFGVSADVVLNDWSQVSFASESPYEDLSRDEANRDITRWLRLTTDLHFGLEFWMPATPLRIQAGYAWIQTPFKNEQILSDKQVFSGGISTLFDQSLLAQASIAWASWERSLGGWGENLQQTHLLMTLAYRF